ncbi:MAG TPA: AsmA-like C-terminal domain-containing protein, partial [Afifellaceae bacterium]|nr:AsmA-like C-terminal domain-containing protein [Afifellaceae bacterium]
EEGATSRFMLESADGGEILRFLDVYNKVRGGRLSFNLVGHTDSNDGSGILTMTDFKIRNEKALAKVVRPGAIRDTDRAREHVLLTTDTENIGFKTLNIPFRRQNDVLAIGEAFLRGPVMGATGRGTVDLDRRNIAISGTFVPAFGINNIAGSIPLFGRILGGGRNEGLVGITYKVAGPLAEPTMTFNPMSAIAPGIFRKIFEYQ